MNWKLVWISSAIVALSVALMASNVSQEHFVSLPSTEPRFLTAAETRVFLAEDSDGFVGNLSPINLAARGHSSASAYLEHGQRHTVDFTQAERAILMECARNADAIFANKAGVLANYGLTEGKINDIPWNFAKTTSNSWEQGMPHTRLGSNGMGVIFLTEYYLKNNISNFPKITRTLIHEKIHLYQKTYHNEYHMFLLNRGYTPTSMTFSRARQNPDTDRTIWKSPDGTPMVCVFRSDTPRDLLDIDGVQYLEHPMEYMAYLFADTVHL
jgi:hypothetical protein